MSWIVPPEAQGQIVEVAYRWGEGCLLKRVWDRSTGSKTHYRCDEADEIPESWHPVNEHPPVSDDAWIELDSASVVDS